MQSPQHMNFEREGEFYHRYSEQKVYPRPQHPANSVRVKELRQHLLPIVKDMLAQFVKTALCYLVGVLVLMLLLFLLLLLFFLLLAAMPHFRW